MSTRRLCAWCGRPDSDPQESPSATTHVMCASCVRKAKASDVCAPESLAPEEESIAGREVTAPATTPGVGVREATVALNGVAVENECDRTIARLRLVALSLIAALLTLGS